jgi:RNA polymerase sigma-70 factor (ECF subfamily)
MPVRRPVEAEETVVAQGPPHKRREEFERVALPHLKPLFNLALKLTRSRRDAEDLVQETYLRAFRFFDSYEKGTQIKAWMFRILRNTFINRYRAAKVRPEEVDFEKIEAVYEKKVEESFLIGQKTPSPEEVVMNGVLDAEVQDALASLPEEYRSVVMLALMEDLSYKEIANILSIPLGTVMSRLHRGRKLLQAALLEYAEKKGILKPPASVSQDGEATT